MKPVLGLLACFVVASGSAAYGSPPVDFYAGPSANRFTLLRGNKTSFGYQLGGRYWFESSVGLDAGWWDAGSVDNIDASPVFAPDRATAVPELVRSGTVHARARAGYALLVGRVTFAKHTSGLVAVGPARVEAKVGSNRYYLPPSAPGSPLSQPVPIYSETLWSWRPLLKVGVSAKLAQRWEAEIALQYLRAGSLGGFNYYGNADIGRRRIEVMSCGVSLIYKFQ